MLVTVKHDEAGLVFCKTVLRFAIHYNYHYKHRFIKIIVSGCQAVVEFVKTSVKRFDFTVKAIMNETVKHLCKMVNYVYYKSYVT